VYFFSFYFILYPLLHFDVFCFGSFHSFTQQIKWLVDRHGQLPGRGPPAYNAKPSADVEMADGVGPMQQRAVAVDGPLMFVADRQPGWQAPTSMGRNVNGPVAHRQPLMMDGNVSPSTNLMAHRGLVRVIVLS